MADAPAGAAAAAAAAWGVVLAGGRSRRMGRDKATLPWPGGGRLVDRTCATVRAALAAAGLGERVVVSGAVEGLESVPDAAPGLGPVGGVASALEAALAAPRAPGFLLVVPVDLASLTAAALAPLLAAAAAELTEGEATAAAPRAGARRAVAYAGRAMPFAVQASAAAAAAARALAARPDRERSVRRLLASLRALELALDPAHEAALDGVNTPHDLARALARSALLPTL